jgi:hypothetical protein
MSNPEDASITPSDKSADQTAWGLPPELQSYEARLAKLSPRDDRLDRERLVFLAGQASMATASAEQSAPAFNWRRHPAWPSAFAAMSALAATLLAILITRSAVTDLSPSKPFDAVAADRPKAPSQSTVADPTNSVAGTLSPRDALQLDVESLLAVPANQSNTLPNAADIQERPTLTPSAWQRVSDGMVPDMPQTDSSSLPTHRGIHS